MDFKVGQKVKIKAGDRRPCSGQVGTLTHVPEQETERFGFSVLFKGICNVAEITFSYHIEEIEPA